MKFLKNFLLIVGGIITAAAVVLFVKTYFFDLKSLWMVANSNRSVAFTDPRIWVAICCAACLAGGILLGMGITLPKATFRSRYATQRKSENALAAEQAGYHGATGAPRPQHDRSDTGHPDEGTTQV